MRKISFSDFTLIPSERRLLCADREVGLNPKAFDLLAILAENPGQVVSKEEIMERVWADAAVEEGNLAVQISNLRSALRFFSDEVIVRTVPGVGYCFAVDTTESEVGASDPGCDHDGKCVGVVVLRNSDTGPDGPIDTLNFCLESAASEHEEIHLYSRKPNRGIQRAMGGVFVEIRTGRSAKSDRSDIAIEFTNPATGEVRFRTTIGNQEAKTMELGIKSARRIIDDFFETMNSCWRLREERRERSSRSFLNNMLTQIAFLLGMETAQSLTDAESLADSAIEQHPSDHRAYLLKLDAIVRNAIEGGKPALIDSDRNIELLMRAAERAGAPKGALLLASAKITGLIRGDFETALQDIERIETGECPSEEIQLLRADLLFVSARRYEAKLALQNALERNPLSLAAMRRLAKIHFEDRDWKGASRIASSLLRFMPSDPMAKTILDSADDAIAGSLRDVESEMASEGSLIELASHRRSTMKSGRRIPNRDHLLAIAIMKEAGGDAETGSAYRRMAELVDSAGAKAASDEEVAPLRPSNRRRPKPSADRSAEG